MSTIRRLECDSLHAGSRASILHHEVGGESHHSGVLLLTVCALGTLVLPLVNEEILLFLVVEQRGGRSPFPCFFHVGGLGQLLLAVCHVALSEIPFLGQLAALTGMRLHLVATADAWLFSVQAHALS